MPIFSVSPVDVFITWESDFNIPDITLIYDILPTKGSETVLKTNADSGSSDLQLAVTVFPFSTASLGGTSSGDGSRRVISLSSISTPERSDDETHTTGVMIPLFIPVCMPFISSS